MGFFDTFYDHAQGVRGKTSDWVWWNFLFVLFCFVHYITKTKGTLLEGTVWFFFIIWVGSILGLLYIQYENRGLLNLDFKKSLSSITLDKLTLGILGVEGVALLISVFAKNVNMSFMSMYVPQFSLNFPTLSWRFYDDILFNIGPVATAEESLKALAIIIMWSKYGNTQNGRAFSFLVPIGFWALLHGYQSYVSYGPTVMWLLILGAFLSGLVMYWVWRKTDSLLVAILVHGAHNAMVILAPLILAFFGVS
jgi:membrane protease YdiL (CAAX protease family)